MSSITDIYNPPPAPIPMGPPPPAPIRWTLGDLGVLVLLAFPVYLAAAWAWAIDPTLGLWVSIAGVFMILETWFSALTFLARHPTNRLGRRRRWMVFLVALSPWLLSLGLGVGLMLGLFALIDRSLG